VKEAVMLTFITTVVGLGFLSRWAIARGETRWKNLKEYDTAVLDARGLKRRRPKK
jgi:hypothetical protein